MSLCRPTFLAAQAAQDTSKAPVIRGIELVRQEIFDSAEATNWVARLSNTLHIRTRPQVIERELLFKVGQPYDSVQVAESGPEPPVAGHLPRGAHRFRPDRQRARDAGDHPRRLDHASRASGCGRSAGRSRSASPLPTTTSSAPPPALGVSYSSDPVRTNFTLELQPAAPARPHPRALGARWEDRSDGTVLYGAVGRPFYSITDPLGLPRSRASTATRPCYQYLDGIDVPVDSLDHLMGAVRTSFGVGAPPRQTRGYTRAGVLAQVVRNDYQPVTDSAPIPKTVTAAVGGYAEWSHSRFLDAHRVPELFPHRRRRTSAPR